MSDIIISYEIEITNYVYERLSLNEPFGSPNEYDIFCFFNENKSTYRKLLEKLDSLRLYFPYVLRITEFDKKFLTRSDTYKLMNFRFDISDNLFKICYV